MKLRKNTIVLAKNFSLGVVDGLKFKAELAYVNKEGYLADIYVVLDEQSAKNNRKLGLLNVASEMPLIKSVREVLKKKGFKGTKDIWSAESGIQTNKVIVFESSSTFENSLIKKFGWVKKEWD